MIVENRKKSRSHLLNAIPEDLGPIGQLGAGPALARLEQTEATAYARLQQAIDEGDQFKIKAAQEFYLRSSESLRRLDLAVETERRAAGEQVPKRQVGNASWQIAQWVRIAFERFIAAESGSLMEFDSLGEFKLRAITGFKDALHLTVKNSLKSGSTFPEWARAPVSEAWNVPRYDLILQR